MATAETKNELVLNPRKNSNAQVFEPATSVHREELEKVSKLIGEALAGMEVPKDAHPDDELNENENKLLHQHDAIFIHGERGAGKTSFILSLKAALNSDVREFKVDGVRVLDTLDPSLMEESEVFLAAVISNLLREVQRHQKHARGSRGKTSTESDRTENLSKAFEQLGESLRVLFPGGQQHIKEQSADARGLAKELLKDAGSAIRLGERFHRFVMACAQELGVKAFVQPIDDVDTSFTRAWPVLETIRRFLSSKRFQVVLAGDLELFHLIVRQEKLSHLEKLARLDKRTGKRARVHAEVDTLLHQYMLKLLAPQRRIRLSTLQNKIYRNSETQAYPVSLVIGTGKNDSVPLEDVLKNLHIELFGWHEGIVEPTTSSKLSFMNPKVWPQARILPENLRLAVRFLAEVNDWYEPAAGTEAAASRLHKLIDLFEWELKEEGLNPDWLKAAMRGEGYGSLAEWMIGKSKEIPGLRSLDTTRIDLPVPERKIRVERIVLLIQAALHHAVRRNPGEALRQLGGIWRPVNDYVEGNYNNPSKDKTLTADDVCLALRLRESEPPCTTAWRTTALQMHRLSMIGDGVVRVTQDLDSNQRMRGARLFSAHWVFEKEKVSARKRLNPFWAEILSKTETWGKVAKQSKTSALIPPFSVDQSRFGEGALAIMQLFLIQVRNYQNSFLFLDFWKGLSTVGELLVENVNERKISQINEVLSQHSKFVVKSAAFVAVDTAKGSLDGAPPKEPTSKRVGRPPKIETTRTDLDKEANPTTAPNDEQDDDESGDTATQGERGLLVSTFNWLKSADKDSESKSIQSGGLPNQGTLLPTNLLHQLGERLLRNLNALSDKLRPQDYTIAATLERWVSVFLHHLLHFELRYRGIQTSEVELNVILVDPKGNKDQEDAIFGEFGKSLNAIAEGKHAFDLPLFRLWASCPLLLACLRKDLRNRLLQCFPTFDWLTKETFNTSYTIPGPKTGNDPLSMDIYDALSGLFVIPETLSNATFTASQTTLKDLNDKFSVNFPLPNDVKPNNDDAAIAEQ